MAASDEQLIKRRVYDDNGVLIREDLAPLSVKNERVALMRYWEEADAAAAEAEAAAAQAEADRIAALEQTPPEAAGAMALAALQQRADALEEAVGELRGLALATPDEVLRGAAQIARVAGLASEIEAAATEAIAQVDGVAAGASQRLAELDGQLASVVATAGQVVADCRAMTESNNAAMVAKTTAAISKRIAGLEVQAAQLRGPKGNTGNPGTCTTVGAGRPEGPGALEPLIGRGAIQGDVYIDGADDNRRAYRWTGQVWEPGPAMATIQVRDVKVSALDASTKTTSMQTTQVGGGSGSGNDPLLVNTVTGGTGTNFKIGDNFRWAAAGYPSESGVLTVEIQGLDGSAQGMRGFATFWFVYKDGRTGIGTLTVTEAAVMGDLLTSAPGVQSPIDLDLTGQRGTVTAPSGLTGVTISSGAQGVELFLMIVRSSATTTRWRINGNILWSLPASSVGATTDPLTAGIKPAWYI